MKTRRGIINRQYVSVASGGALAAGGASISISGMVVGSATTAYGASLALVADANFGEDFKNYQDASLRKKNPSKNESEIWKSFDNVKGRSYKTSGQGKEKILCMGLYTQRY